MSHKSRLTQNGDWLRYNFASYDIIITCDRTGTINAFHNVCRHRAYPVIEKEGAGNNKILACRYHGWSYGLNGRLAKAPGYQELNLDKDQNSLFRCDTKIDNNGFIWINMDAREIPEITFDQHFGKVDSQDQQSHIDFDDYSFALETKKEVSELNWKHQSIHSVPEQMKEELGTSTNYFFPNAASTVSTKFFAIEKIFPQAPNRTIKHYEIYRHKDCSSEQWETISDAYSGALESDKATQSASGEFYRLVRDAITDHYKQEKAAGKEIRPSRPTTFGSVDQLDDDDDICAGLACGPQKKVLAW